MDNAITSTNSHITQLTEEHVEKTVNHFKLTKLARPMFGRRGLHNTRSLEIDAYSTKRYTTFEYEDAGQHYSGRGIDKQGLPKQYVKKLTFVQNSIL